MFARTFSFCRRLMGKQQPATVAVHDDRRLWMRYQANLPTQVQLGEADQAVRIAARLRDISAGGANLMTDQPFQIGQIISLELAAPDAEVQVVVACIVRAAPAG